jgi:hypothetical protein
MWRVAVDQVYSLKGHANGRLVFYLYNWAPGAIQNGNFEWLAKGDRRILFLVHDGPVFRSVADLYGTSILVPRRGTPELRAYSQSTVGEKIARFQLTPATGEPAGEFAETVPLVTPDALKAAGYQLVATLLENLIRDGPVQVRREACLVYYERLFGENSCVKEIEGSGGDLAGRFTLARERRNFARNALNDALRSGVDSPLTRCAIAGVEPNDPLSATEFLQYMSKNPDPVFRSAAEKELERLPRG